jgi:hypothetical protein
LHPNHSKIQASRGLNKDLDLEEEIELVDEELSKISILELN